MGSQLDLKDVCAGHPKAAAELARLKQTIAQRETQLQLLHDWMRRMEWHLFCGDYPDAHEWFDEDGMLR